MTTFAPPAPMIAPAPPAGQAAKEKRLRLARSLRLSDLYEQYVWPLSLSPGGRKLATRAEHEISLRKWEAICGAPTLIEIDQAMASRFVDELRARRIRGGGPPAAATVAKHCGHLQLVLDHAGPSDPRRGIVGAGILPPRRIPYLKHPPVPRVAPRVVMTLDQIAALMAACEQLNAPVLPGITPALWWRALILFAYNTGLRRQALFSARWEWLDAEGWLHLPGWAMKRGSADQFWCNEFALAAIEPLRAGGTATLFPWPWDASWFHTLCHRAFRAAKIPPNEKGEFGVHRLRRTLITWLAGENALVAAKVAGHRGGVTGDHYVAPQVVQNYLRRVPQPGASRQMTFSF